MDAFAVGLETAEKILKEGKIDAFKKARYSTWDGGDGAAFEKGKLGLKELAALAPKNQNLPLSSGKDEYLEQIVNLALLRR
jgi:xylose isomerase